MDELEQLAEAARSMPPPQRRASSSRETSRENRAIWAVGLGVVAAAIGLYYMTRLFEPSGGGAPGTVYFPSMRTIVFACSFALLNALSGMGAIALGLSALHTEIERYSFTALGAVVLGSIGWLGLILVVLS